MYLDKLHNPYITSSPVTDTSFIGREGIFNYLRNLWLPGQQLQSVLFVGHRRMGKTSILQNLGSQLEPNVKVAYINLQLVASLPISPADFLNFISDSIAQAVGLPSPKDQEFTIHPLTTFRRYMSFVNDHLGEDKVLILALDEYESITDLINRDFNGHQFEGFFRNLPSIIPKMAIALAGLHDLQEMARSYKHPYFHSFTTIKIQYFTEREVKRLLTQPTTALRIGFTNKALQRIYTITHGQPLLVQIIGNELFDRKKHLIKKTEDFQTMPFTVEDVETLVNNPDFYERSVPYLAGVWEQAKWNLDSAEILIILSSDSQGKSFESLKKSAGIQETTLRTILEKLKSYDIILKENGDRERWYIAVELFRRWILMTKTDFGSLNKYPLLFFCTQEERPFAESLATYIQEIGIPVELSTRYKNDDSSIRSLILKSREIFVFVNPNTMSSECILKHIEYANANNRMLVPVILKLCKLYPTLVNLNWIDARGGIEPRGILPDLMAAIWGESSNRFRPPSELPPLKSIRRPIGEISIELSIRFTTDNEDSSIRVNLFRPDTGVSTEPAPFAPLLDSAALKEIRWYLETFSVWPTGPDYARAARIESQLEAWGRALRDAVLATAEAARLWQQFLDAGDERQITIDATDPRVLRLPWELLADEAGHLFAQGVSIRRRLQKTTTSKIKPLALPVRILVVIARPDDAGFIDPRAEAQALLDATDSLGDQVVVEFLTPPTLKALTNRLRDKNAPPVHVVHFDGHGVYDQEHGLGYLLFENADYQKDLVDANRLGTLLSRSGVPLMVLSACQSTMQEEVANPYASVAARLIRDGVGSVLAMNYSVLVAAAHKFTAAFYQSLAAGQTVGQAVDEGRATLLLDTDRHTLTRPDKDGNLVEVTVKLQDWFLPSLYQQAADPVIFTPDAQPPISNRQSPISNHQSPIPADLPPAPPHGFHGRSREMLALERAFAAAPLHVLHGFGGLGKTALAVEAGRWFRRTGRFPGGAAFVSFEGGGSLDQLCSWAGQTLSGDKDWAIHGEETLPDRLAALLRERPALLILDNFESVLGKAPLMPPEELQELLNFVGQVSNLSGQFGKLPYKGSCVLITTRDTSFNDARFAPSRTCRHIPLSGLAAGDALALAAAILDDYGIDRPGRRELVDLMTYLGGHPLSLNLVLPRLREYSPAELIARFEELLPGFTRGQAAARNESLAVSLEFSLRRLGDETRAALPDLAVFQGECMEDDMLEITQMDAALWQTARTELEQAALVRVERLPGIEPPFLYFHPTLLPYLSTQLGDERRAALEERYWKRYYAIADYLYRTDSQNPHMARAIAVREMPNLRRGLALALAAGALDEAVDFAARIARFLDVFGRWRERDEMMAQVSKAAGGKAAGGKLTKAEFLLMSRQGDTLLQQGRAAQAEAVFRELLARLAAGAVYGDEDTAYDTALTQMSIGRCLEAQGQPVQAIALHQQALAGFAALSEGNEQAKRMLGKVYPDLADNLAATGQFDEAQKAYESGLEISREVGDDRTVGVILGQLGTLALRRGDLAEAQRRYRAALDTFRALGEPQSEAVYWHQLGMVAEEAREWAEAERCYRESLQINEARGDLSGVARTYNQLAIVAEGDGRPADAERWYLRAIEVNEQLGQQKEMAVMLSNLADLYLSQNRLAEAETTARRALAIKETLDLSAEPWTTYSILAGIAAAQNRPQEAAQWRRKEQESRDAFPGTQHQIAPILQQFQGVIAGVVAASEGDQEARAQIEGLFDTFQKGNWQIVDAIQRIWNGERDADALTANIDYNSRAIVLAILAQLAGAAPANAATKTAAVSATPPPQEEGITLEQLLALVAQAIQPGAPAGLSAQLHELTQTLAHSPQAPPEIRALGQALNAILSGDRDPDLTALPPELAAACRSILQN